MNSKRTSLPSNSLLQAAKEFKHIDSYRVAFTDRNKEIDIVQIGRLFFSAAPGWVSTLFAWRNRIVKLLGLKIPDTIKNRKELIETFTGTPGEQIGLFRVLEKSAQELILGEDDKHLDFRVSLLVEDLHVGTAERQLTISTSIHFNNWLGKLYFIPVQPFHRLIVRSMLKQIGSKIKAMKQE